MQLQNIDITRLRSRSQMPVNKSKALVTYALWLFLFCLILLLIPPRAWEIKSKGFIMIAAIGIWRYSWFFINVVNSVIYEKIVFPKIQRRVAKLPDPYPRRVYFMIPSYHEEYEVTKKVFQALVREACLIPSEVNVYVSVGSRDEAEFIDTVVRLCDPEKRIRLVILYQSMGKRVAMGHTLRAIARHFNDPLNWHPQASQDVVVFMDGDTVIGPGVLRDSLPYFKAFPELGALTTDEEINYLAQAPLLEKWYRLKFTKRHIMMKSHSLFGKVLTLTGRYSLFRASIVLSEEFIRMVESDHLKHYIFGKFRFLMGDDKSTWFFLLKNGWKMLYLPHLLVFSTETRKGNFFKISSSLMFRWYGNMLRNNWRAIKLGPKKVGSIFIWCALIDQRISMWTTLIGPVGVLMLSAFVSPFFLAFYSAWVILTRTVRNIILTANRLTPEPIYLPLILYDQWVGSVIKIYASFNLAKQKWAKLKKQSVELRIETYPKLRRIFPWFLLWIYITLYLVFVGMYVGVIRLPSFLAIVHAQEIARVVPNDGKDDSLALQRRLDSLSEGEILRLPSGSLDIFHPLIIRESSITIKGDKTLLISHIKGKNKAIITLEGERGPIVGHLKERALRGAREIIVEWVDNRNPDLYRGDLLYIAQKNSKEFLRRLGSRVWYKDYPILRQTMVRVAKIEGNRVILIDPLDLDLDKGADLRFPHMLKNVVISSLTLTQAVPGVRPESVDFVYSNPYPSYEVDGIVYRWVRDSIIKNVEVFMIGRNPINIEHCYGVKVIDSYIKGAWNKGKGGTGYFRISQSFRCLIKNCEIEKIRHLTIQWASSQNIIEGCLLKVDINFHGGFCRHNKVIDCIIDIPRDHPWGPITKTPLWASWAPPDGGNNKVEKSTLQLR